ncbi:MAG: cell division protein FtsZ [Patescibacteria group bacterium]
MPEVFNNEVGPRCFAQSAGTACQPIGQNLDFILWGSKINQKQHLTSDNEHLTIKKMKNQKLRKKPAKNRKIRILKKKKKSPKIFKLKKVRKRPQSKNSIRIQRMKKVRAQKIIQIKKNKNTDSETDYFFRAKIRVIGIGGGGGSIVSEIGRSLNKASFVIADSDSRGFTKKSGIKYFPFGENLTHGLGTGLNVELGKEAASQAREKIQKLFEGQDIVILVASLGGGMGSGATQIFAQSLPQNFSGITLGVFTLPFKFEGSNKFKIANKALWQLRDLMNVSITIPNEKIFKIIGNDTPITQAFSMVNKSLVESLESLIDIIYSPGIINIDFADLKAILSGMGSLAFLNTVEVSGKDKTEKAIKAVLNNPLYQSNNFSPAKVLFNIAGGGNLSMHEVDKISSAISEKAPNSKIIFGISKNSQLKNKIRITLLMTGPSLSGKSHAAGNKRQASKKLAVRKLTIKQVKSKIKTKSKNKKIRTGKSASSYQVEKIVSTLLPVFNERPVSADSRKLSIIGSMQSKKAIRRNALEIRKEQEMEEKKKIEQEKEWEIPAFLRLKK